MECPPFDEPQLKFLVTPDEKSTLCLFSEKLAVYEEDTSSYIMDSPTAQHTPVSGPTVSPPTRHANPAMVYQRPPPSVPGTASLYDDGSCESGKPVKIRVHLVYLFRLLLTVFALVGLVLIAARGYVSPDCVPAIVIEAVVMFWNLAVLLKAVFAPGANGINFDKLCGLSFRLRCCGCTFSCGEPSDGDDEGRRSEDEERGSMLGHGPRSGGYHRVPTGDFVDGVSRRRFDGNRPVKVNSAAWMVDLILFFLQCIMLPIWFARLSYWLSAMDVAGIVFNSLVWIGNIVVMIMQQIKWCRGIEITFRPYDECENDAQNKYRVQLPSHSNQNKHMSIHAD